MRFVAWGCLLGIVAAVVGLTSFDLSWLMAAGVWFLGGALGTLAAAMVLMTRPAVEAEPPRPTAGCLTQAS